MKFTIFILVVMLSACRDIKKKDTFKDNSQTNTNNNFNVKKDFTNDSIIHIQFPPDSNTITVTGKIIGINNPVEVFIPVKKGKFLTVTLVPEDTLANLRLNQIIMPYGKADGPFERNISQKVTKKGTYKVIVGENLMRGEEWKGKFYLTAKVE